MGESRQVKGGNLKEMAIGNKKFKNTRIIFNDLSHLTTAANPELDGIIGYDIVAKQKLLISPTNKKMVFID